MANARASAVRELAILRLDEQLQRLESYQTRASYSLAFASTVLTLTLAVMVIPDHDPSKLQWVALCLSLVAYAVMVFFCALVFDVRELSYRPDMKLAGEYGEELSEEVFNIWLSRECILSIDFNEVLLASKAQQLRRLLYTVPIQVIFISLSALAAIANK